jgi:hypothetical protein
MMKERRAKLLRNFDDWDGEGGVLEKDTVVELIVLNGVALLSECHTIFKSFATEGVDFEVVEEG